ncbi:hypothetical protein EB118_05865 [bacterium]|nr:hypothetical protein [bacterium]NDG29608.1 hypothetical protein [bacterium]
MNYNYTLKYRTFDSLLEDVKIDLKAIATDTTLDPSQLYKVAMRVNYDLGLRIYMTKEKVLEVCKGKVKLPDDFYVMNFALICGQASYSFAVPQGTNVQDVTPEWRPWVEQNYCSDVSLPEQPVCLTKCGSSYQLIQVVNTETRTYDHFAPIRFRNSQFIDCDCPNLKHMAKDEAYIKDGWIYTSLEEGNLYINYQGTLENSDGQLMVPDHPMLNEYYEYAMKKRILENLIMDGNNVGPQLQLVAQEYRAARNYALSIVNTPNFSEMEKVWAMNRKAMYGKYYDMFKSYPYPMGNLRVNNVV